jgi:hypothetical protein
MNMKKKDAKIRGIDFSDIPEMTDEQLAHLQPSHLRNPANFRPIKRKSASMLMLTYWNIISQKARGIKLR